MDRLSVFALFFVPYPVLAGWMGDLLLKIVPARETTNEFLTDWHDFVLPPPPLHIILDVVAPGVWVQCCRITPISY